MTKEDVIRIEIQFAEALKALDKMEDAVESYGRSLDEVAKKAQSSSVKMEKAMKSQADTIRNVVNQTLSSNDRMSSSLDSMGSSFSDIDSTINRFSTSFDRLGATTQDTFPRITEQTAGFGDKIKIAFTKARDGVQQFASKLDTGVRIAANKFADVAGRVQSIAQEVGSGLENWGNKLMGMGFAWSAAISYPLKQLGMDSKDIFLGIEKSWGNMAKSTGSSIEDLKGQYEDLAVVISNKYGVNQELAIDSMNDFAKAGYDTNKEIRKLTESSAIAAVNFDMGLGEATESVRQIMLQWQPEMEEVDVMLSVINEQADLTATSERDLVEASAAIGDVFRTLQVPFAEMNAYLAAIQGRGYSASEASTALRMTFQNLTNDTDRLSDTLGVMGTSVSESELQSMSASDKMYTLSKAYGKFKENANMSTDELINFAEKAADSEEPIQSNNKAINDMMGSLSGLVRKRHISKVVALMDDMSNGMDDNVDSSSEYQKAMDAVGGGTEKLRDALGSKTEEALQNASAKWDSLTEKMRNAKAVIGGEVIDVLTPLADKLNDLLESFQNLSPEQQEMIVRLGMMAVAMGPLLIFLGLLVSSGGKLIDALGGIAGWVKTVATFIGANGLGGAFSVAASAAGPVIAVIGALIIGFIALKDWVVKTYKTIKENFIDKIDWEPIKKAFNSFIDGIKEGFKSLPSLEEMGFGEGMFDNIAESLTNVANKINEVDWSKVAENAKTVGEWIGKIAKVIVWMIKFIGFLLMLPVFLTLLVGKFKEWSSSIIEAVVTWVVTANDKVGEFFSNTWSGLKNWVKNMNDKVGKFFSNVWSSITGFIGDVLNSIIEWGAGVLNEVSTFLTDVWNAFVTITQEILDNVTTWLTDMKTTFNENFGWIIDFIDSILNLAQSIFNVAFAFILLVISNSWNKIKEITQTAWDFIVNDIINPILEFLIGAFETSKERAIEIFNALKDGLEAIWLFIKGKIIAPIVAWIRDNIINNIKIAVDWVIKKFDKFKENLSSRWESIKTTTSKKLESIKSIIKGVWDTITGRLRRGTDRIKNMVTDAWQKVKDSTSKKLDEIKTTVKNKWKKVTDPIKNAVNTARTWGNDMIKNFIKGVTDKINDLSNTMNNVAGKISEKIHFSVPDTGPLADADEYMPDFIDLLILGIDRNKGKLSSKINELAQGVRSAVNPQESVAFNASLNTAGLQNDIQSQVVAPISATQPQQNISEIHKHYEVRPGVMIAKKSEQRQFVREIRKLEEMEDIRTGT